MLIGNDCSYEEKEGYWEVVYPEGSNPRGSASHASIVHNDSLWVFGGSTLGLDINDEIYISKFDFIGKKKLANLLISCQTCFSREKHPY